jgi:anti-sigma factor RsiW
MIDKRHKEWTDRLSDFVDGTLSSTERGEIEEHLAGCGGCREIVEDLRAVVARARALDEVAPPRDLWGGIAAAIGAPIGHHAIRHEAGVIRLPTAGAQVGEPSRGILLTGRQLAAAAVVLMMVSAAATWWAGPGLAVRPVQPLPADAGVVSMAAETDAAAPRGLAEELAALEAALAGAGETLDPNTVRLLESNLEVIDHAIADSRRALALDPGNPFLAEHLERSYERKLSYLRETARIVEWAG